MFGGIPTNGQHGHAMPTSLTTLNKFPISYNMLPIPMIYNNLSAFLGNLKIVRYALIRVARKIICDRKCLECYDLCTSFTTSKSIIVCLNLFQGVNAHCTCANGKGEPRKGRM